MIKKTMITISAFGLVGAVSLTPIAPAEAFFLCAKSAKHKDGSWCERRAERRAKTAAWWQSLWRGHEKKTRR
jgi:hypothetical protein